MKTANIEDFKDTLADEGQFPARMGYRDPRSPNFVFFDDDREIDPEVAAFREDLLDFEEWNAGREAPTDETVQVGMFTVTRAIREYDEAAAKTEAYLERQESRRFGNWLIDNAKRRVGNNDHWRKLVMPLSKHLDDPENGPDCLRILKTMRECLPFAPGPVKGTVFVNPDGSRHATAGVDPGNAKASFIKRHKLDGTFVSVERVQKEGEKHSTYVVGTRRASNETASNYYDPNPGYAEKKVGNQWVKVYQPSATNLYRVPESKVFDGYRLTVREFEQAVIAGAETFDSNDEAAAREFETTYCVDSRINMINLGYGSEARDESALTHEEAYLHGVLRMFGEDQACELMLLKEQEPGALAAHFMSSGAYTQKLIDILQWVADQDKPSVLKTKHLTSASVPFSDIKKHKEVVLPPENETPMLPFVIAALTDRPVADIEDRLSAKSVSRDNIRLLSQSHTPVNYGFDALIAD